MRLMTTACRPRQHSCTPASVRTQTLNIHATVWPVSSAACVKTWPFNISETEESAMTDHDVMRAGMDVQNLDIHAPTNLDHDAGGTAPFQTPRGISV